MRKKEIIILLKKHLETMPKPMLENLLDHWEGRTPHLFCEPSEDCYECKFPEDRICDDKTCEGRIIQEF